MASIGFYGCSQTASIFCTTQCPSFPTAAAWQGYGVMLYCTDSWHQPDMVAIVLHPSQMLSHFRAGLGAGVFFARDTQPNMIPPRSTQPATSYQMSVLLFFFLLLPPPPPRGISPICTCHAGFRQCRGWCQATGTCCSHSCHHVRVKGATLCPDLAGLMFQQSNGSLQPCQHVRAPGSLAPGCLLSASEARHVAGAPGLSCPEPSCTHHWWAPAMCQVPN